MFHRTGIFKLNDDNMKIHDNKNDDNSFLGARYILT